MKWLKDLVKPKTRAWEEFYRNRWQHDKVIRSTHGVNCTGGCSWMIYVKDGIVTWEMQALDYPLIDRSLPAYEPRGCQRGISFSWYLYSPIRVKYPYMRGALLDFWREARKQHEDPVEAWASLQADPVKRARYQRARGKGGFRRVKLEEAIELLAASNIYTAKEHGPDRIIGFSPIPAMSQLSYASGARMLQLMGGINLSFYDWYSDLPPASPEIWGEQTDVAESADWFHSKMIAVMGSNPNMTRTPDCHFLAESRHNGTKLVVFAPDFNQVAKFADQWIPINAGQDGAFWMAVNHIILKEFYVEQETSKFTEYIKQYSDSAFLVELHVAEDGGYRAGQMLRANRISEYADEENGDWKFLVMDETSKRPRMLGGGSGHRWQTEKGHWNLKLEDPKNGEAVAPKLSVIDEQDGTVQVEIEEYDDNRVALRGVPVKKIRTIDGKEVLVTTVFDLLLARCGVNRGLEGEYPADYDDAKGSYTPAWQERWTGINRKTVIEFARNWAKTAKITDGKCCIIIGAGINHWYHNNLMYRSGIVSLILTGCIGKNGGGLNHYVGQEKLAPVSSWSKIAFAGDWQGPPRLQNAPSWHYIMSDQWRYEGDFTDYHPVPKGKSIAKGHTADLQVLAVKAGWLPFFPQFDKNSIDVVREAREAGADTDKKVVDRVVDSLKSGDLTLSVTDPDAPENWPRVWYIWRGNALMASAKGHEYFNKHYLGTHSNAIGIERCEGTVHDVKMREAPEGKFDLIVDLNFRMDTSALYSDIILPAATWYEKDDLNSTDMHTYIHPLSEAVPPAWESRSDWDLFREISKVTAELSKRHFPEPFEDVVMTALAHDTIGEIAQTKIADWSKGECEAIPGKTMPNFSIVKRDYSKLYERYTSLGPNMRDKNIGAHGVSFSVKEEYNEMVETRPTVVVDGETLPSIMEAHMAADAILHLAPETNGEVAYKAYLDIEEKTGLELVEKLAQGQRKARSTFKDIQAQPNRLLNSPCWSGLVTDGRSYSAFCHQVEHLVPWRTLTGRQHLYLDHPGYIDFGEHLPTYKPTPLPADLHDLTETTGDGIDLNYLTPHGKWHIHSTYGDTHRMMTLSRGCEPVWMNPKDAEAVGIVDNDHVEIHNDHGVMCTRAVVSHRIPRGVCIVYHSPERTINVAKSPLRKGRRGGGHNSLTRIRLKPNLLVGGYGQFTYHFNYWGPTGVNRDTTVRVRKMPYVEY